MRVILVCALVLIVYSARVVETESYDRPVGIWSASIEAQEQFINLPAQYFLCGFQFQSLIWTRTFECRCHTGFYRWRRQRRCDKCAVNQETKTAGIRATFCNSKNWHDQISKILQTGNTEASSWRNAYMCGKNQYAHGFAVRLANQFGMDIGLNGLKLRCSTFDFSSTLDVEDEEKFNLSSLYISTRGRFISSINLKIIPNQNLIGFLANFEPIATVSNIQFIYNTPIQLEKYPEVIQTQWKQNCGNQLLQFTTFLSKNYEVKNIWKTSDSYVKNFVFSSTIGFSSLYREVSGSQSSVQTSVSQFSFNKDLKIVLKSPQLLSILVQPKSKKIITYSAQVKKGIIPFQSVLTFVDQSKGNFILNYTIEGVWEGVVISSIPETKIRQDSPSCQPPKNLRV